MENSPECCSISDNGKLIVDQAKYNGETVEMYLKYDEETTGKSHLKVVKVKKRSGAPSLLGTNKHLTVGAGDPGNPCIDEHTDTPLTFDLVK